VHFFPSLHKSPAGSSSLWQTHKAAVHYQPQNVARRYHHQQLLPCHPTLNIKQAAHVPQFANPDEKELTEIEESLLALDITLHDFTPSLESFTNFQNEAYFPTDYHGGIDGPVWDEKLLEHWIAYELLGVTNYQSEDIYIDIAAGNSPWAQKLHERYGIASNAIDLNIHSTFENLPYYKVENATASSFEDSSVTGASLQCAYEMFAKQDDISLWKEMARILKPGGKVIIVPLYLHSHYCAYATPDYYGKGYSDSAAKEYVCSDWMGIPSARFYDTEQLKKRVLDTITSLGMEYKLHVLRNKSELGNGIYCHFILEVTK